MLFGIYPYMSCTPKIWDTYFITYCDFMVIVVTCAVIKGKSQSKLKSELDFEPLKFRCWFRKLCTSLKLKTSGLPEYLLDLIPQTDHLYNNCLLEDVITFHNRTDAFKYLFFDLQYWNGKNWIQRCSNFQLC